MADLILSAKYFNIIALAALAAKLTFIDSTLMQRATDTYLAMDQPVATNHITGFANQTFPLTGTVTADNSQPGLVKHWMGDTLKMWNSMGGQYPNQVSFSLLMSFISPARLNGAQMRRLLTI